MLTSPAIGRIVYGHAANPDELVARLVAAANAEGGKDNVTAVFAAGPRFAERARGFAGTVPEPGLPLDRPPGRADGSGNRPARLRVSSPWWLVAIGGLAAGLAIGAGLAMLAATRVNEVTAWVVRANPPAAWARTWTVGFDANADFASIDEAMAQAKAGDTIRVEPGEYRAPIEVRAGIALVSARRHQAIIRPALGGEPSTAVSIHASHARLAGFRIAGDVERPLDVGVRVVGRGIEVDDVDVAGAAQAAVLFEERSDGTLTGSSLRDNPGPGVLVRPGATAALRHNVIAANGRQPGKARPGVELQDPARAVLSGNIITGNGEDQVSGLPAASRAEVMRDNIVGPAPAAPVPGPGRRQGAVREPVR